MQYDVHVATALATPATLDRVAGSQALSPAWLKRVFETRDEEAWVGSRVSAKDGSFAAQTSRGGTSTGGPQLPFLCEAEDNPHELGDDLRLLAQCLAHQAAGDGFEQEPLGTT